MILAAGLGTRLRPLTDSTPKALIEVGGITMLERVARRLLDAGARRLIINLHHHADRIERFVAERDGFGVPVAFSREPDGPLDTGGGLLRAVPLFEGSGPFMLHNVDVVSDCDLRAMLRAHGREPDRIATLATSRRETTRPLLVDETGMYGVANRVSGWSATARPPGRGTGEVGFCGIHVCSRRLLARIEETGSFSIIRTYLRLIEEGERIGLHDIGEAAWFDVGTPERLNEARTAVRAPGGPTEHRTTSG